MEFSVGDSVEAVDQLGIWTKAKVVSKSDNAIVVNFPPWRAEWDREIIAPSEIRKVTPEETLIPRRFANNKVTVDLEGETCFNIWEVDGNKPLEEAPTVAGE